MYSVGDKFRSTVGGLKGFTIVYIRSESYCDHPILTLQSTDGSIYNCIYPTNIDEWLINGVICKMDTIDIRKQIKKLEIQ